MKMKLLKEFVKVLIKVKNLLLIFLVEVNQKINQYVNYTVRLEVGVQTCKTTLEKNLVLVETCLAICSSIRHLGLAARFVSGYLVQLTADVKSLDGPSGPEADFTDYMHGRGLYSRCRMGWT